MIEKRTHLDEPQRVYNVFFLCSGMMVKLVILRKIVKFHVIFKTEVIFHGDIEWKTVCLLLVQSVGEREEKERRADERRDTFIRVLHNIFYLQLKTSSVFKL